MALNERAQAFFFRIQRCGRKLANLKYFDEAIHFVEPAQIALDDCRADFFRNSFALGIGRGGNFKLARERGIDGIRAASFGPGGGEIGRGR